MADQDSDSRYRVALDLMLKIGAHEAQSKSAEQAKRDYWLKLYKESFSAVKGGFALSAKDQGD